MIAKKGSIKMFECGIDRMLTIGDVAEITRIKVPTLRKYTASGKIPHVKIYGNVRYRASVIEAWIEGQAKTSVPCEQCTVNGVQGNEQ
jgi:excisionase family DNA binding protein